MSDAEKSTRLSVAIIVRDDAQALEETLSSVAELANETVVLDTGSSDSITQIARRYEAQIFLHSWRDDFAAARNECLDRVTGDWVLWLDAGEQIHRQEHLPLRKLLDQGERKVAHQLFVQIPGSTRLASAERVCRTRLVPRHAGVCFSGRVRESMEASLEACQIEIKQQPITIHRANREHDLHRVTSRAQRDRRIASREIREKGPTPRLLNCLGDCCQVLADSHQAEKFFRHALTTSEPAAFDMLEAYYGLISALDGDLDAQVAMCVEALEVFPRDIQLLCALGGFMHSQGRTKMVVGAYQAAYRHGRLDTSIWHLAELYDIVAICYSRALQMESRDAESLAVLEQAAEMRPTSVRIQRQLIDFYVKHGAKDSALNQVEKVPAGALDRPSFSRAVAGALLAARRNWKPAQNELEQARAAGCADPFCLRWLTMSQIANGEIGAARQTLEEWLTVDPQNPSALHCEKTLDAKTRKTTGQTRYLRIDSANQPIRPVRVKLVGRSSVFEGA